MKEILTEDDAAAELQCAVTTVQELARTQVLPGVKLGRSWVFPRAALLTTLNTMAMAQLQKAPTPQPSQAQACNRLCELCIKRGYRLCANAMVTTPLPVEQPSQAVELTDAEIRKGWEATFSTNNPFCPCNLHSFHKSVRWAVAAINAKGATS